MAAAIPKTKVQEAREALHAPVRLDSFRINRLLMEIDSTPPNMRGVDYYILRGKILFLLGRHQDAKASYQQAYRLSVTDGEKELSSKGLLLALAVLGEFDSMTKVDGLSKDAHLNYLATGKVDLFHSNDDEKWFRESGIDLDFRKLLAGIFIGDRIGVSRFLTVITTSIQHFEGRTIVVEVAQQGKTQDELLETGDVLTDLMMELSDASLGKISAIAVPYQQQVRHES